jgi:hypothetical protein
MNRKKLGVLLGVGLLVYAGLAFSDFRRRQAERETMSDLRIIAITIHEFLSSGEELPELGDGPISRLYRKLPQEFSGGLATRDGWGSEYLCSTTASTYVLVSLGADGTIDQVRSGGIHPSHDADIVLTNIGFWQIHAGYAGGINEPLQGVSFAALHDVVRGALSEEEF